ncbi:MAG: hypothetical protein GC131_01580 [Alphaproteobacteria bacterium]|nr:hypothetical protein [Alphaproteobacteria bacterium]
MNSDLLNSPVLAPEAASCLCALYSQAEQKGHDGSTYRMDATTRITPGQGIAMAELIAQHKPARCLEIGFAYGFSTLFMLGALLKAKPDARLTSMDPWELTAWHGIGLRKVEEAGAKSMHVWMEEFSHFGLPQLLKARERFDFIYIDGDHRFDAIMLDFFYAEKLLGKNGILVFDDYWMPSTKTAISFIDKNYALQRRETACANIVVYQKTAEDERGWWHFEPFAVDQNKGRSTPKR